MNTLGMNHLQWVVWFSANALTGFFLVTTAARLSWDRRQRRPAPDRAVFEVVAATAGLQYMVRPVLLHISAFWPLIAISALTTGVCAATALMVWSGWRWVR